MPHNSIHILYHGTNDVELRQWLRQQNVKIHDHDPQWKDHIEEFRRNGDPRQPHLFRHAGEFLGNWQRVDIPLFVNSEYCLQLDVDTVVVRPFTMADFGLNLTLGLALSSEVVVDSSPLDTSVMLVNIPRMRETYDDFLECILKHVSRGRFDDPSPLHQRAYNEFYREQISFLPNVFNFKPFWELYYLTPAGSPMVEPFIVRFHGPKPHDYIKSIMKASCANETQFLCDRALNVSYLCQATHHFAKTNKIANLTGYCDASFSDWGGAKLCNQVMESLAHQNDACGDFSSVVHDARKHLEQDKSVKGRQFDSEGDKLRDERYAATYAALVDDSQLVNAVRLGEFQVIVVASLLVTLALSQCICRLQRGRKRQQRRQVGFF